jgi:hypothetical protein
MVKSPGGETMIEERTEIRDGMRITFGTPIANG